LRIGVKPLSSTTQRGIRTKAAAEYLGLAESTLEKDRVTNKLGIPYYKIGRVILYDIPSLDTFLDKHRRRSTSEAA
jgi:hypothetical protein